MEKDQDMQESIDTNLYSRQIGTFGMETMGKLIKLDCLIVGMRGVSGLITSKSNISLAWSRNCEELDTCWPS